MVRIKIISAREEADPHASGDPSGSPPDARALKVSVVGASRGRSDDCTYSMVSFENTVSKLANFR